MNKLVFSGRIVTTEYTTPHDDKKSRAVVKIAADRKGKDSELELIAFSQVADFIGKGLGMIPMDNKGGYIEKKCFLPGCRAEGYAYVSSTPYTDKNGVQRSGYQLVLDEINSDPLDAESQGWLNSYMSRQANSNAGNSQNAQNLQQNQAYGNNSYNMPPQYGGQNVQQGYPQQNQAYGNNSYGQQGGYNGNPGGYQGYAREPRPNYGQYNYH